MKQDRTRHVVQRVSLALCTLLTPLLLTTSEALVNSRRADASSHREAPLISQDQYADNTDTYVFVSPTNPDNVVLVASWIPFEGPEGGPNYFEWGNGVLYDINVDNNGDAVADYTYTLSSTVAVQNPLSFLYNTGPIGANGENWNRQQRITVTESSANGTKKLLDNVLAPPVNIGSKSTDNYDQLEDNFIYQINEGGDDLTIYAGQTDDAFWVDLQVFDLLTLRGQAPPVGYTKGNNDPVDSVAGFNAHSLVIEAPISRLTRDGEPVLGVWATARRPAMRVLNGPAGLGTLDNSGDPIQVSRLGMPLVNEVVLPYALKDAFNSIPPSTDAVLYTGGGGTQIQQILQGSVEDPEVGNLLCGLYGVPLPGDNNKDCQTEFTVGDIRSGRGDIFDIFLTGMVLTNTFTIQTANGPVTLPPGFNVNRPANVVPAEMIRINTAIKGALCSPKPSRLGILGGDACGFPNGRRLFDDIVEIELLAVAGAAYQVLDGRDTDFSFNTGLIAVLDDNVDFNDRPFRSTFPYMALAQSGQEHIHDNPMGRAVGWSTTTRIADRRDDAEERKNGAIQFFSHDLELGQDDQHPRTVGLRFSKLGIPKGVKVTKAYIQFVAEDDSKGAATLNFYGEAADNSAAFANRRFNISQRSPTAARVTWSDVPTWEEDQKYWTPDLGAVVQEIVSRPGWSPNNALTIIVTGMGERSAWAFDGSKKVAPKLYVEFTAADGSAAAASADSVVRPPETSIMGSSVWDAEATAADIAQSQVTETDEAEWMNEDAGMDEETPDEENPDEENPDDGEEVEQPSKLYLPLSLSGE
jgi:hypothetical protein